MFDVSIYFLSEDCPSSRIDKFFYVNKFLLIFYMLIDASFDTCLFLVLLDWCILCEEWDNLERMADLRVLWVVYY